MKTEIDIDDIKILRNIRTELGDVSDLMSSIRENGLLHPIGVCKNGDEYILVYGHRRFAALKKLGRKALEIGKEINITEKDKDIDLLILNIVENYHVKPNTPIEFGKACSDLRELGLSIGEISVRLSAPKTKIKQALGLLSDIPQERRNQISYIYGSNDKKGKISATVSSSIAYFKRRYGIKQEDINKLFDIARDEELSTKDLRIIGIMISEGKTLNESILMREDYTNKQCDFIVNKKELEKIKIPFKDYIISVLIGKTKFNRNLFYKNPAIKQEVSK